MDIYQQIAQTGYHHQAHLHVIRDITLTQGIILDLLLDIITGIGTGITGPDPSHILADIEVTVIVTCIEVTQDHIVHALPEALYITVTQALIIIATTHHTGGYPHIEAPPLIPEIAADPGYVPQTNQVRPPLLNLHPVPAEQQQNTRIRDTRKLPLMTPSPTTIALPTPVVILKII